MKSKNPAEGQSKVRGLPLGGLPYLPASVRLKFCRFRSLAKQIKNHHQARRRVGCNMAQKKPPLLCGGFIHTAGAVVMHFCGRVLRLVSPLPPLRLLRLFRSRSARRSH